MKKSCLAVILLAVSMLAFAVPALRMPHQLRLTDGSLITAYLIGDEHYSWFQTEDGYIVEPVGNDLYELTSRRADDAEERAKVAQSISRAPRRIGSQATAPLPSVGSPRIPVILVNFTDSVFTVGNTPEEVRHYFDLYCNGTQDGQLYTGHNSYGAIRDYFMEQSKGLFSPEFSIIGPVTLNNPESYYGNNSSSSSKDTKYSQFVKDALTMAVSQFNVQWSDFDNRNKGQVDMVFFIFAGCGENTSGIAGDLWPKESPTSTTVTMDDGTQVICSTSACGSESTMAKDGDGKPYTMPDGIGVMCHELCHALGLPDLYDTNYKAFGMDVWSIMDYGEYVANGRYPVAMTAYERDFMGWQPLQTLSTDQWLSIGPIATTGDGYKILCDANPDEYYILEGRLSAGCDERLSRYGHGLQVTHVDFNQNRWNSNRVNTTADHQLITIIAANDSYLGSTALQNKQCTVAEMRASWAGNLYPYINKTDEGDVIECNDSLTTFSTPAATTFAGDGLMHKDIHAIREQSDTTITLYFGHADITDAPLMPAPPVLTTDEDYGNFMESTTVSMTAQPGVDIFYTLDGSDPTRESIPYTEPITLTGTTTIKAIGYVGKELSTETSEVEVTRFSDAINDVTDKKSSPRLYDLSGRPVKASATLRPGVYLQSDGKKFIQHNN